jgi:hypothetical protein
MNKSFIKQILRESFGMRTEVSAEPKNNEKPKEKKAKAEAEYAEITNGFEGLGAPSQADIMQMAGMGSVGNKTDESLFGKKLRREKNDEGGIYQFNEKERASVIKAQASARK